MPCCQGRSHEAQHHEAVEARLQDEIQLFVRGASGQRIYTSFRELVEGTMGTSLSRTDLHLSRSRDGEIFLTSRQDGMVRMLVPDSGRDR